MNDRICRDWHISSLYLENKNTAKILPADSYFTELFEKQEIYHMMPYTLKHLILCQIMTKECYRVLFRPF